MAKVKVMISLEADLLEALDKVAATKFRNRSQMISEVLQTDPDIYEVLEGIRGR